jgi:RNA polymerase sigma-70 factor (ECF subfamily)
MPLRFATVFEQTREQVFAFALRITGNRALAEDVTQETFLEVHRGLAQFRGEAQVSTWVLRIALRVALRAKCLHRRTRTLERADAPSFTLDDALIARLDATRVNEAMLQLTLEHRTVLALFAVEGLSHQAIAETLGIPEGTVWSRLHQARKRLNECLAQQEP